MDDIEEDQGGGASDTTSPASGTSAATDVSLKEYFEVINRGNMRWLNERDRRYAEVQAERDKAEVIRAATQAYRDEKANELREQISQERGRYVTQSEMAGAVSELKAILEPLVKYVAGQQGGKQGALDQRVFVQWAVYIFAAGIAIFFAYNS